MSKKCIKCGSTVEDDYAFCPKCGMPVSSKATEKRNGGDISEETSDDTVKITITRDKQSFLFNPAIEIFLDGSKRGDVKSGESLEIVTTKGTHSIVFKYSFRKTVLNPNCAQNTCISIWFDRISGKIAAQEKHISRSGTPVQTASSLKKSTEMIPVPSSDIPLHVEKCPNCGSPLENNKPICSHCGTHVVGAMGGVTQRQSPQYAGKCPNCGSPLGNNRSICPHCGTPVVGAVGRVTQQQSQEVLEPSHKTGKIVLTAVVIFIALFVVKSIVGSVGNTTPPIADDTIVDCAEKVVSDFLRAPSQARWYDTKVLDHDNYGRYLVHLEVDAMNGFGGYERQNYLVVVFNVQSDGHFTEYPNQAAYQLIGSNYTQTSIDAAKKNNFWGQPIDSGSSQK